MGLPWEILNYFSLKDSEGWAPLEFNKNYIRLKSTIVCFSQTYFQKYHNVQVFSDRLEINFRISHGKFQYFSINCHLVTCGDASILKIIWFITYRETYQNRNSNMCFQGCSPLRIFQWKIIQNLPWESHGNPMGLPWEIYGVRREDYFFTPTFGTRVQNLPGNFPDTIWISTTCWVKYFVLTTFQI